MRPFLPVLLAALLLATLTDHAAAATTQHPRGILIARDPEHGHIVITKRQAAGPDGMTDKDAVLDSIDRTSRMMGKPVDKVELRELVERKHRATAEKVAPLVKKKAAGGSRDDVKVSHGTRRVSDGGLGALNVVTAGIVAWALL